MLTRRQFIRRTGLLAMGTATFPTAALACLRSGARDTSKEGSMEHVQTVLGPVAPSDLGLTLIHEHVMCDFIGADKTGPHRWQVEEVVKVMLPYLRGLQAAGARTFVDCSPKYIGRDPSLLKRLSEASGLHIITNTGLYKAPYLPPYALEGAAELLAEDWIREAEQGIEDTGVRPGFIKIAANEGPLNPIQEKVVRAAALTHLRTGLTIASHTTDGGTALQEMDVLAGEGVGPSAFIWVHADAGDDAAARRDAAARGAWIELDAIDPAAPERHIDMLRDLLDADFGDRVLLSQDRGWYNVGEPKGGSIRPYEGLLTEFVPALKEAGVAEETVNILLVDNPRRALEPTVRKT
jgi:phosphotriesterase-related protein